MKQGDLTRQEAYEKMREGFKISHSLFTIDEYLYIEPISGFITDELGRDYELWWLIREPFISEGIEKPWRVKE